MRIITVLLFLSLFACIPSQKNVTTASQLDELTSLMSGSYTSAAQSLADSTYFDITMHSYPIWENLKEQWLYVEQAITATQDKPYRQRVYKLEYLGENEYRTIIYELPEPENWIGQWKTPSFFTNYSPGDLLVKEGCHVYLSRIAKNLYRGGTKDTACKSSFWDSDYATSEVEITKKYIISWDRGYDTEGKKVWGAEKGGYRFERVGG